MIKSLSLSKFIGFRLKPGDLLSNESLRLENLDIRLIGDYLGEEMVGERYGERYCDKGDTYAF